VAGDLDGLPRSGEAAEKEFKALQLLKGIRHPFLLNVERVEVVDGELLIVTELADRNLRDVLSACQKAGIPSIPRTDLLRYLEEAAEVLDLMTQEHQLLHLDVKPDNIFLVANHAKVGDFGLLTGMVDGDGGEASAGGLSPAYAAPEVFCGQVSPQSDQYSLAVVYCELRTGVLPFQGKGLRRLMLLHTTQAPDLSLLPAEECEVVARALAKEPRDRFLCSKDFVQALRRLPRARPTVRCPWSPAAKARRLGESRRLPAALPRRHAAVYQDEVDSHRNPTLGLDGLVRGQHKEVVTPGHHVQRYLAGALDVRTGLLRWGEGERKASARFMASLGRLRAD
jgi:serine/threonine protein kinase